MHTMLRQLSQTQYVAAVVTACLGVTACREPTQAYLELSTDAVCADVVDTSITIASDGDLETSLPDTTTQRCFDISERIGSLAVVPSGNDHESLSIRIVTGLGKSADDCVADKYLGGCIVARRSLHYIPHETLYLPIDMSVVCRDIPCGATQTCSHGHCVDAAIADVESCTKSTGCNVSAGGEGGASSTSSPFGGNAAVGGTASTTHNENGGNAGRGGADQGGAPSVGGASGAAGSTSVPSNGGTLATGGATSAVASASGGTGDGGSAWTSSVGQGGTSSGSELTGGSSTGGVATGGVATGGVATGGVATGGVATGGVATGGVATGGVATGGATVAGNGSTGGVSFAGASGVAGATGLPSFCGDGLLDAYSGEFCDSAGSSPTCNANCTPQRCGDGVLNAAAGETCDGSTADVVCTPSCRISTCGDGYVDRANGEQCEAGMSGCTACQQDIAGLANSLRVSAKRGELLLNTLALNLTIANNGPAVSTNGLTLRYYYTPDSNNSQSIDCTSSDVGCGNITVSVRPLPKTCTNASHYAELAVKANTTLRANTSFDVNANVSGGLLALYNFGNDYSRPSGLLFASETEDIALYQNGKLVWGIPPCGCGNGTLDSGEACDHAGPTAACNADCTWARCGDGKVNAAAGETCDQGAPSLTCNPECHSTGLPSTAAPSLLQWLDASNLATVHLSPRIAEITDRSGSGNDVVQFSLSRQPLWFPNAFGSLPAIFFDGENHELVADTQVNDLGRGSIFVVHRVEPYGITATLIANGWSGSGGGIAVRARTQLDGLGLSLGASTGFATTQWTLGARSGNGPPAPRVTYWAWQPPSFAWASGADSETLTATASYTTTPEPLALGGLSAKEPFRGWIGEMLVFDRMLTVSERDAILTYLRQKWGVL